MATHLEKRPVSFFEKQSEWVFEMASAFTGITPAPRQGQSLASWFCGLQAIASDVIRWEAGGAAIEPGKPHSRAALQMRHERSEFLERRTKNHERGTLFYVLNFMKPEGRFMAFMVESFLRGNQKADHRP